MTLDKIRELYDAQPFRAFVMHLADGRQVRVKSREFIMEEPKGRTVVVCRPKGNLESIDLESVTDLEVEPLRATRSQRRRR